MPVQVLQTATAYNASDLTGVAISTLNAGAILVWFTPAASYDGVANFEVSPNGGTTWFGVESQSLATSATKASTVSSPGAVILYTIAVPSGCLFRVRMSGGTQGSLTVSALTVNQLVAR